MAEVSVRGMRLGGELRWLDSSCTVNGESGLRNGDLSSRQTGQRSARNPASHTDERERRLDESCKTTDRTTIQ
jgi:hypothetical protein